MDPYEKIQRMNYLIGNQVPKVGEDGFWEAISNQTSLVTEESNELLDEVVDQNLEKTMKELSDVMVVVLGLYQKLEEAGVDMSQSLHRVCDNNLEKFHRNSEHAKETVRYYVDKGFDIYIRTINTGDSEYYAVINKKTNKLLKPHDFKKVSLSDLAEAAYERSE